MRETSEPDVRGVGAHRLRDGGEWPWRVEVWAAEYVRDEPLETQLRSGVRAALASVAGVTAVEEEDREVWVVAGNPAGDVLVRSVAEFIDQIQREIREHIQHL